ncbi:MAG: alpha/beta fold hydrolase [Candidatus Symbiodolus clandestinus]
MLLHYRLQGHGPAILLLHGLFGSLDNLGVLVRDLQRDHCVVAVDLRNHGRSFHDSQMAYPSMVTDLIALLQHLSLPSVTVIGHSMGGKAAMAMALLAPQWLERLVVLDIAPVAYSSSRHQPLFAAFAEIAALDIKQRQVAAQILRAASINEGIIQFLLKSFDNGQWRFNWPVLEQCYPAISGWGISGQWLGPSCFIGGQRSDYLLVDYHPQVKQQFPQSVLHSLPEAGHWLAAEQPDAVLAIIRRFFSEPILPRNSGTI